MATVCKITNKQRLQFQSFVVLKHVVNFTKQHPVKEKNDVLAPVLNELVKHELLETNGAVYAGTDKGKLVLKNILNRERDFLVFSRIYSGIDFKTGQFAWIQAVVEKTAVGDLQSFLNDERWYDLRLTVAEFKNISKTEAAFYLALYEGVFEPTEDQTWDEVLMSKAPWAWINQECKTALTLDDLTSSKDNGQLVSGTDLLKTIMKIGSKHNQTLNKHNTTQKYSQAELFDVVEPVEPTQKTFRNYLKASYASPCWYTEVTTGKKKKKPQTYYW